MSEIANDALSDIDEPETISEQDEDEITSEQDEDETTSVQDEDKTTSVQDEDKTTSVQDENEITSVQDENEITSVQDENEITSVQDENEITSVQDEDETTSQQDNLLQNNDEQPDVIVVDTVIIKKVKQPVPVPPPSKTGSEQDLEFLKTIAKLTPIVGPMVDSIDRVNARQPDSGPAPDPKDFTAQAAGAIKDPGHPSKQLG
jgi:hypothetical protein